MAEVLEVAEAVGVAVLDDFEAEVAHDAPLDEGEVAEDCQHVGRGLREGAVHGVGGGDGDSVEGSDAEVERDLGIEALARGRHADLAQLVRPGLGERDPGDVVRLVDALDEAVEVLGRVRGRRDGGGAGGEVEGRDENGPPFNYVIEDGSMRVGDDGSGALVSFHPRSAE